MSTKNLKRIVSTIGIMLFFLPFFQTCSDESLKRKPAIFRSQSNSQTQLEKDTDFEKAKEKATVTGYYLALDFEFSAF